MPFVPRGFDPPKLLETPDFRIRPLSVNDVVKDYDAVMTSREYLWSLFGEVWGWPSESLTFEQDLIDLGWHQKEFQINSSYNFAVMKPDESKMLGCFYIDPPTREGYDADFYYWIRSIPDQQVLEKKLFHLIVDWIKSDWPFENPAFPGREISWEDWNLLTKLE